ncbi:class I SAM-dependent methyltransferase [Mycobacterium sp. C31M]
MGSRRLLFRTLYRLGFTPWDGHPLADSLTRLVADTPPTTALDLGCGTGDNAIYLADHGWQVTGVDYIDKPLGKARTKAGDRPIRFLRADVTELRAAGVAGPFHLVIDSGCLHGMNDADRDGYVREVTAVTNSGGRLLIVAFVPGSSYGVPGITPEEVRRRFADGWALQASGDEPQMDHNGKNPARFYLFHRH